VIGFRYHLVSLAAVLLAVALGVLLGTTQLSGAIGDDQKGQIRSLSKDNGALQAQLRAQTARTRSDDTVTAQLAPRLVAGALRGARVVVVATPQATAAGADSVIRALISADKAGISLTIKQASAIDLAGRDVFEAVQVSVNPKVIETPKVAAVAKDGIQLLAQARITIRANINRLVGGAGEQTILARVGEGIVSTIGSADSHKHVLESPDMISKTVLAKGLDSGTAFDILSIDIADVDVGKNIGAQLQTDQAEADKRIAQAKAEERRALAVAVEQEQKARVQEMRAEVVRSEAQIPLAIAEAFRKGNLGIMDFARYRNLQADTSMRAAIAGGEGDASSQSSSGT